MTVLKKGEQNSEQYCNYSHLADTLTHKKFKKYKDH